MCDEMLEDLIDVACRHLHRHRRLRVTFILGVVSQQPDGFVPVNTGRVAPIHSNEVQFMASLTDNQQQNLKLGPLVDKRGNPTGGVIDPSPVPTWTVDNPDVLALTPAADGMSCAAAAMGVVTSTPISVSVNGKSGGQDFTGVFKYDGITPDAPVSVQITADPPTEQP